MIYRRNFSFELREKYFDVIQNSVLPTLMEYSCPHSSPFFSDSRLIYFCLIVFIPHFKEEIANFFLKYIIIHLHTSKVIQVAHSALQNVNNALKKRI